MKKLPTKVKQIKIIQKTAKIIAFCQICDITNINFLSLYLKVLKYYINYFIIFYDKKLLKASKSTVCMPASTVRGLPFIYAGGKV